MVSLMFLLALLPTEKSLLMMENQTDSETVEVFYVRQGCFAQDRHFSDTKRSLCCWVKRRIADNEQNGLQSQWRHCFEDQR